MRRVFQVRYVRVATIIVALVLLAGLAYGKSQVTIATYSLARYEILRDKMLPQWKQAHPDIEVVLELHTSTADQLQKVMLTAGTEVAPDIIDTAGTLLFSYIVNGGAVDLSPYIARDLEADDWFPHTLQEVSYPHEGDAGIYALPYDWVGGVMVYNKTLFDNAGMPYPDETWTWEDLRVAARRLTQDTNGDGVNDVWGYNLGYLSHMTFDAALRAYGGELLSPDRRQSRLNTPVVAGVLQLFYEMVQHDRSTGFPPTTAPFTSGRTAIDILGSWEVRRIDDAGLNYGVEMVPAGPVTRSSYGGSNVWAAIKRTNQDMEAVWTIMQELVSYDTLRLISNEYGLPARISMVGDWVPTSVNQVLVKSSPFMHDGIWTPDWSSWQLAKRAELEPAVQGLRPIPEAMERAVAAVDRILSEAYK